MRSWLPLLALLVFVPGALRAQATPYGRGTSGLGGFVPLISGNGPYMGNAAFGLRVDRIPGGAPVLIGLSTQRAQSPLLGGNLLIALTPPDPFLLQGLAASGPNGVAGQGSVTLPLPLAGPPAPGLAGLVAYGQALVDASPFGGMPALTSGLRVELTLPPLVFVGSSIAGGADPFQLIDPQAASVVDTAATASTDNTTAALFAHGGRDLFVGSSIRSTVSWADATSLPLAWTVIYTSAGQGCYGLELDRIHDLLWTLTDPGTGGRELVALDADPASPAFGNVVFNTTGMTATTFVERWALAPSGSLAAVLTFLPATLFLVDTNPTSPGFLTASTPVPVPVQGSFSIPTRAAITPGEEFVLVTIQNPGSTSSEVARFHVPTGQWWDHDPVAAGIQNLGPQSQPPITFGSAATDIEVSSNGSFAVVTGFGGCGWSGRLDFDLAAPNTWAWTPWGVSAPNTWSADLRSDDLEAALASWPATGCANPPTPQVLFVNTGSGQVTGTVPVPFNTNSTTLQNLYTVAYR